MNLFKRLTELFPSDKVDVGEVIQTYQDGVLVLLQTGGYLRALGTASVGDHVFVQGGKVIGTAPALSGSVIEV